MADGRGASKRQGEAARREAETLEALIGGYRPLTGAYDEMADPSGQPRTHWQPFLKALAGLGSDEISRRFDAADRYMRDAGVFYRVYDGAQGRERPWPLSHLPVLIDADDWQRLSGALVQRAELLDTILRDIYGPARLVADGVLPAAAIAGSPEFLRPLVGTLPRGERFLRIYAADIGRGPDGRWWILSDRAQAPSGAGYALENRIALSRALPESYRALEIERLASFFQSFRSSLSSLAGQGSTRVGLLTPGPYNETYFEHAYLARYLGFLLVEGEDLKIVDDRVHLRTVGGLMPIDVLVRRLDSDFADPLELNVASRLGVPGLVRAIKAGQVALANALGTGVVESRALMSFTPAIQRHLFGEDLLMPNIATWWCGQKRERDLVLDNLDEMVIAPAFGVVVPGVLDRGPVLGASLDGAERARVIAALEHRGADFVGQEVVTIGTTPVWTNGRLAPSPMVLRAFVAANADGGWTVMPGGFCRVSDGNDVRALSMQAGGRSSDVWVISHGPVDPTTLLPAPESVSVKRQIGSLPSRAADNLFWLGRYMERTDTTLRLLRAYLNRAAEADTATRDATSSLLALLMAFGTLPPEKGPDRPAAIGRAVLTDTARAGSAATLTNLARGAAAAIRERLSPDAWRTVTDLADLLGAAAPAMETEADALDRAHQALRLNAAFSGLVQENMNRLVGWRFLDVGRRLERAVLTCRILRALAEPQATTGVLDALLEVGDSQITYRQRYVLAPARVPVLDLLYLDVNNPRSVAFQAEALREHVDRLPGTEVGDVLNDGQRIATRLAAELRVADAREITADQVFESERDLFRLSDAISLRYFALPGRVRREWEAWT